jgi:aryl-phospho-beta-D-glucosidase BglC (GH1 family)
VTKLVSRLLSACLSLAMIWAACGGGGGTDAALGAGGSVGYDGGLPPLGGGGSIVTEVDSATGVSDVALGAGGIGGGMDGGGSQLPTCGRPGFPCCSGNACSESGCCVQGVCASAGAVCGALGGVCNSGTCGTCGGPGLNCCSAAGVGTCTATGTACASGICVLCGGAGQACCAGTGGNTCLGAGLVCNGTVCVAGTPDAGVGGVGGAGGGLGGVGGRGGAGGGVGGAGGGLGGAGGGLGGAGGKGGAGGGVGGVGGTGGSTACSCTSGQICAAEGRCILPGTIDDFGSCDVNIYAAEGRAGTWFAYMGSGVFCDLASCAGISAPPWGTACGVWIAGGLYDSLGEIYAGVGVGLNGPGVTYDACGYSAVEVTYATDQSIKMYAKWNNTGELGSRSYVLLPATSGTTTTTVSLASFTSLVCSKLTEFEFEPTSITAGFGIAVYGLRFLGTVSTTCTEGESRCASSAAVERCVSGAWTAVACAAGETCVSNRCVSSATTPVQAHGNLSVSGTKLVDQSGSPVRLKGVSSQWLNYEYDGYATNLPALVWMRDNWKLSVIRAAMGVDPDQTGAYLYSAEGKANMQSQLETVIQNAVAAGVYVIVDWHSHMAEKYTTEANAFFKDISRRYGQYPNVIYEAYNEPLDVAWTTLKQYHQNVYTSIRSYDADLNQNVILLGTPNWDQDVDVAAADPMAGDTNIMYTLHFYACSHNSATGHLAKAEAALAMGLPIFVSEWGATAADGGTGGTSACTSYADEWHGWMDSNNISWAAWKLDDCDGLAVADTSCILKLDAPLTGGWTSSYLNGHGPYVVGKLTK